MICACGHDEVWHDSKADDCLAPCIYPGCGCHTFEAPKDFDKGHPVFDVEREIAAIIQFIPYKGDIAVAVKAAALKSWSKRLSAYMGIEWEEEESRAQESMPVGPLGSQGSHGRAPRPGNADLGPRIYVCNACNVMWKDLEPNFCPKCGAKLNESIYHPLRFPEAK